MRDDSSNYKGWGLTSYMDFIGPLYLYLSYWKISVNEEEFFPTYKNILIHKLTMNFIKSTILIINIPETLMQVIYFNTRGP